MSFIIKGFDTDGNCLHCYFQSEDSDRCILTDDDIPLYGKGHPNSCPLLPLPEGHGDLVERKALNLFSDYKEVRNRIKQTIKATERDKRTITGVTIDLLKQTLVALDSLCSVRRYFLDAKTIVPAEGGDNNEHV